MTKSEWQRIAKACAREAHETHFHLRRGTCHIEKHDVVVLFNNHPYNGGPHLRDEELARFRRQLEAEGIEELGYATYPDDGYSYALVVDAGRDRLELVDDLMHEAFLETLGG